MGVRWGGHLGSSLGWGRDLSSGVSRPHAPALPQVLALQKQQSGWMSEELYGFHTQNSLSETPVSPPAPLSPKQLPPFFIPKALSGFELSEAPFI